MMKKNSVKILTALSAALFMTTAASANFLENIAKDVARDAARGAAIGIINNAFSNNNNNSKNYRTPPGHKNLGPVKKGQRNASTKQAPKSQNTPSAVAKSTPKAVAPVAVARVADPNVLEAQKNLAALGFTDVGTPDGFAGKGTASAVKAFQKSNGLPETGVLSATVIALIAKDAMIAKTEPTEAITEVAEIAPQEEFEPENFVATEVAPDPIPVADKVAVPEVEKAPEKAPEPVATAVASVATPETKTQEVKAVETPVASENEW